MATKKAVQAIVKKARESYEAAKAAGIPNPAPYGLITLRFPKEVKTQRFTVGRAGDELWNTSFKSYFDDYVEIGQSQVLFRRFEIVGLERPFDEAAKASWEEHKREQQQREASK